MPRSVLDKASRLARRGRDAELIALLEPQLPLFRDSPRYYRLLGSACLRAGDLGGAHTYLKRAEQLEPGNRIAQLSLAALHLRRGESEKAVALYLALLDRKPRDKLAARSLAYLKRQGAIESLGSRFNPESFARFCPREPGLPPFVIPLLGLVLALGLGFLLGPQAFRLAAGLLSREAPRPEVEAVVLSEGERTAPLVGAGKSLFILTEEEALAAFERAKKRFQEYRDNAALVEINRLLESNASASIKDKAKTLRGFVAYPDWRAVKDLPLFADIVRQPRLYEGCAVVWKGRAANIKAGQDGQSFDFLVGYHDRKRLEGIAVVRVADPGIAVPAEAAFEILGRVEARDSGFRIECLAIHELLE